MALPSLQQCYGAHDYTMHGYADKTSPQPRHGFVGFLKEDSVHGNWFADATQATHKDVGLDVSLNPHAPRFRYFPYYKQGTIIWSDVEQVDNNHLLIVKEFLENNNWPAECVTKNIDEMSFMLSPDFGPAPDLLEYQMSLNK
jgi:hypothetical protein